MLKIIKITKARNKITKTKIKMKTTNEQIKQQIKIQANSKY